MESSKRFFHLCFCILPCEFVYSVLLLCWLTITARLPTVTCTENVQFVFIKCASSKSTERFPFVPFAICKTEQSLGLCSLCQQMQHNYQYLAQWGN